jgi:hypothetical protein
VALKLNKLTVIGISRLSEPGYYGDGGGLVLQISRSGSKSWLFRYKRTGKVRELGLGSLRTIDLARAREASKQLRGTLASGVDPVDDRTAARAKAALERGRQMSFEQCAAAYIDAHRSSWKNAKHTAQWESTLGTYAYPLIAALPVADVDADLIVKVLKPVWNTKAETATRRRGRA